MTTTISHRELRNNSADILRRVAAGESFDITNHGVVVAALGPPKQMSELERLRLAGRTRPPTEAWTDSWAAEPVEVDVSSEDVLADLRGDR